MEKLMDTFQAIQAFIAVAETGSLSRAALKLGKSPSAMTKALNALEASLGTRLLTRSTRQVALTEAGRIYLETASEAMQQLGRVGQRLRELDGEPRGVLRITAPLSFGRAVLSGFCPAFMQRYPEVELDISLADRYVDLVAENYDLALRLGHHDLPGQIAKVIGDNRVMVCASPAYLAFARRLARAPRQVARYGDAAAPPWPLDRGAPSPPPPCPACGADRAWEMALVSPLAALLDEAAAMAAAAGGDGGGGDRGGCPAGWEWSAVAVATCVASCGGEAGVTAVAEHVAVANE
jgi:DNA-binding transcriptional LysR family regulator